MLLGEIVLQHWVKEIHRELSECPVAMDQVSREGGVRIGTQRPPQIACEAYTSRVRPSAAFQGSRNEEETSHSTQAPVTGDHAAPQQGLQIRHNHVAVEVEETTAVTSAEGERGALFRTEHKSAHRLSSPPAPDC